MGGNISTEDGADGDITRKLGLARGVLQSLCDWSAKDLSKATKICVYETLVLSVLLYNTETWCLTATQAKRLKVFEITCLRKTESVTRRDRIKNEKIYRRVGMNQDILTRIQQRRLRYFGHISRLQDNRYPKIALHGRIQGQQCRGRPKKRWIDTIRSDCEEMNMNIQEYFDKLYNDPNSTFKRLFITLKTEQAGEDPWEGC